MVEAPGVALDQQRFQDPATSRAFPVKLLIRATFDVFIDSSRFSSDPRESTEFVEAFWRRREAVPVASRGREPNLGHRATGECAQLCVVAVPQPAVYAVQGALQHSRAALDRPAHTRRIESEMFAYRVNFNASKQAVEGPCSGLASANPGRICII